MNTIPEQTCWTCKNFMFEYEGDWSDITPGVGLTISCSKSHFNLGNLSTQEDFSRAMQFGFTCKDFEK